MAFSDAWRKMSKRERFKVKHQMQRDAADALSTRYKLASTPAQINAAAKTLAARAFAVSRVA